MNVVDKSRTVSHYAAMAAEARRTTERRGAHADAVAAARDVLFGEMTQALLQDPMRMVETPGYGVHQMSAAAIVHDDLEAGQVASMLAMLASAARGEDVKLQVELLFSILARRHADFHASDAVAMAEDVL